MNRYFTSDQHFSHANIIKYCNRPFADIEEMNEAMVARHNAIVKPGDEVWHLGDFSMGLSALKYVARLNGIHKLVMGNHDKPHPVCAKSAAHSIAASKTYHAAGFDEIMQTASLIIGEDRVLLHHMPYTGDTHPKEERYKDYRLTDEGLYLLHGHVHNAWLKRGRQINVGVDVWAFAPVSEDEILAVINCGKRDLKNMGEFPW
jgi:calcineurin-like phosphoesterase family protein